MKKSISIFALSCIVSYSFAQSSQSHIIATGDFNQADVYQIGTHQSQIFQTSSASNISQQNAADVKQANRPVDNLTGNVSLINQYGNGHESTIKQVGANTMEVYIGADGNGNVSSNAKNKTFANQFGEANNGKQVVRGSSATESSLSMIQFGENNTSSQIASWARSSKGLGTQSGNNNDLWQQVDGLNNEASTLQFGNANYSFQWIENGNSANNLNEVYQSGDNNISRIVTSGSDNYYKLDQLGNDNRAVGISGDQYSNGEQIGEGNGITITQAGNTNQISLRQEGMENTIGGTTVLGALQIGDDNIGKLTQTGNGLKSISGQFGNNNLIEIDQNGNNSSSMIFQAGQINNAFINQAD